jgi:dTDP-4-amino-4,6-dideoxygalactose transaminase
MACGLEPGAEVITVPNTDSTAAAIGHSGSSVVWVDTLPRAYTLDPDLLEQTITSRTRAIVPVHMFGHPARMDAIVEVARRHDLWVIEDAALAVGAEYRGHKVGTLGDIGCFSLAPSKILGAYGDAGIVVTEDPKLAERIRVLRNYGHAIDMKVNERDLVGPRKWRVLASGLNERLDTLQAAILRAKLPSLDERIARRRQTAAAFDRLLVDANVTVPSVDDDVKHVYFAYTILLDNRDAAREFLAARGIATRVYYAPPLHLQEPYQHTATGPGSFPVTEETAAHMLALPIFPQMSTAQVEYVANAVAGFSGAPVRAMKA